MASNSCRICLQGTTEGLFPLYSQIGDQSLAAMVMFLSGIEILVLDDESSPLPQNVCKVCVNDVTAACRIKQTCINSDKLLRSKIKTEQIEIKLESPPLADAWNVETSENFYRIIVKEESLLNYPVAKDSKEEGSKIYKEPETKRRKPSEPYMCFICDEIFQFLSEKTEHVRTKHVDDKKCLLCDYKGRNAKTLEQHLMKIHKKPEVLTFMCHICSNRFQYQNHLFKHIAQAHPGPSNLMHCDHCNFTTTNRYNIYRHLINIHLKKKLFVCADCGNKYSTKIGMEQHQITKHGRNTDFKCSVCDRKFATRSFLKFHQNKLCKAKIGKSRTRTDVSTYMEQDAETNKFRCKICKAEFLKRATCQMHYINNHKHNNNCPHCGTTIRNAANLLRHIDNVHVKNRSFICSYCPKRFGQKTQLDSHINTHTGAKPFLCKFCTFRTGDRASLYKHKKKCADNPEKLE